MKWFAYLMVTVTCFTLFYAILTTNFNIDKTISISVQVIGYVGIVASLGLLGSKLFTRNP